MCEETTYQLKGFTVVIGSYPRVVAYKHAVEKIREILIPVLFAKCVFRLTPFQICVGFPIFAPPDIPHFLNARVCFQGKATGMLLTMLLTRNCSRAETVALYEVEGKLHALSRESS